MNASRQFLAKIGQIVCIGGVIVTAMLIGQTSAAAASEGANVLFILDGSGSMWGRLDNVEKIVIAKQRMTEWVQDWENANMGLIVYGHRTKGDCDDIEVLVPLGPGNQEKIITQIQAINPKGKTPIQRSIALAAKHVETIEEETAIVLVSDGLETCDPDPCGYVKRLKDEKGIKFTLDVVGFDISDEEREQLECLAEAGGGRYYSAKNAMQLKEAFTEVKAAVVEKIEPPKTAKPEVVATPIPEPLAAVEPGLKLRAILREGAEPLTEDLGWWVYEAKQDLKGRRKEITYTSQAAPLFKLSAGRYLIRAKHGNAEAFMEVEVIAGEFTEVTMNLNAGYLRFHAIPVEGAEPLTEDLGWWVYEAKQDLKGWRKEITYTSQAVPLFILSAGRYLIRAMHGDAEAFMEVEVIAGELTEVTMNLNAGYLRFHAIPVEGAEPLTEDLGWWVYEAKQDLKGRRKEITYTSQAVPLFILSAGRYLIRAKHGDAEAFMEVEVIAGEFTEVTMNLNAGYLRFHAIPAEGTEPLTEDLGWWVYEAKQDLKGRRKEITYTSQAVPLFILSAGRYLIRVKHGNAEAFTEVEAIAGEFTEITIDLSKVE